MRLALTAHLLGGLLALALALGPPAAAARVEHVPATVVAVTDGDTLTAEFADGVRERVRLIGIDTPETKHPSKPVQCFGHEATARTTAAALGKAAELEIDVQHRDRYLRLLAYVWIDGAMLNLQLAEEGFAAPLTIPPNVRYAEEIRAAAAGAREAGHGLWSACPDPQAQVAQEIEPTVDDPPVNHACDGSYPDVCIPTPPPDLDCRDIPHRRFRVRRPDPHRLDGDRDGVGCEQ